MELGGGWVVAGIFFFSFRSLKEERFFSSFLFPDIFALRNYTKMRCTPVAVTYTLYRIHPTMSIWRVYNYRLRCLEMSGVRGMTVQRSRSSYLFLYRNLILV